jgi:hypothetical protein
MAFRREFDRANFISGGLAHAAQDFSAARASGAAHPGCGTIGRFFAEPTAMRLYFPSLAAIEQHTLELDAEPCRHCRQTRQLVSHGYVRKKQRHAEPARVGKRVFCSNRHRKTGCGRTMQLYLETTIRRLHHSAERVTAFLLALIAHMTIRDAWRHATGTESPRHAYRWLQRLHAQSINYRVLLHRPALDANDAAVASRGGKRRAHLLSTLRALLRQFGPPLCAAYQRHTQRAFL